jgi:hypothetical protein
MNDLREDEALELFRTLSNAGRWGAADQQGTLNFISAESRRAALQTVRADVHALGGGIVTRGVLLDIVAYQAESASDRQARWSNVHA